MLEENREDSQYGSFHKFGCDGDKTESGSSQGSPDPLFYFLRRTLYIGKCLQFYY
jgi:hypothetical protein